MEHELCARFWVWCCKTLTMKAESGDSSFIIVPGDNWGMPECCWGDGQAIKQTNRLQINVRQCLKEWVAYPSSGRGRFFRGGSIYLNGREELIMPSDSLDTWGSRFVSWPNITHYEQVIYWLKYAAVFPELSPSQSWVFGAYISICLAAEGISFQKLNSCSTHTYVHLYVTFKNWNTELAFLFLKQKQ